MEYIQYGVVGLICLTSIYYNRYLILDHYYKKPGVGEIKPRRNRVTKQKEIVGLTEKGEFVIPSLFNIRAHEIDIYIFEDSNVISESKIIDKKLFKEEYEHVEKHLLDKFGHYIITPITHTKQTKENKLCGAITTLTEFHVYLFCIEDSYVDYGDIYLRFLKEIDLLEEDLLDESVLISPPNVAQ